MTKAAVLKSVKRPQPDDMEKINRYTRRELTQQDVFCFHVILCDNEVDRDSERFTVDAIQTLSKLFLGKTGIFDHDLRGENQTARIYDTGVEVDSGKKTQCNEPYTYLLAKAYAVRTEKNADLILEIDAGIKKEVSVGCSVAQVTCSICGADWNNKKCNHTKGAHYDGKLCYAVLGHPTDAYEWSFVAVPAQRNAGVVKRFASQHSQGQNRKLDKLMQLFCEEQGEHAGLLSLTEEERTEVRQYLHTLQKQAEMADQNLCDMRGRVKRWSTLQHQGVDIPLIESVVDKMSMEELCAFDKAYQLQSQGVQLDEQPMQTQAMSNRAFKIK